MGNYLVTIARQYGSGGREVGRRLAALTEVPFYDNEMITLAAEKSGLDSDVLAGADEKAANSLLYTLAVGSSPFSRGMGHLNVPLNDRLFLLQSEIIRELASDGKGAVIVGRCADYVLSGKPNLVRVFVCAPFDYRVKAVMERHAGPDSQRRVLRIELLDVRGCKPIASTGGHDHGRDTPGLFRQHVECARSYPVVNQQNRNPGMAD